MANKKNTARTDRPQVGKVGIGKTNIKGGDTVAEKKPNQRRNIIIASILVFAITVGLVLGIYFAFFYTPPRFDYLDFDEVSEYIEVDDESFSNMTLTLPLLEYKEEALTSKINALLVKNKNKKALYNGIGTKQLPITIGDLVGIRYRSYIIDEEGREVELDSNLANETVTTLEVGAGKFVVGFEEFFIGKVPEESPKFERIYEGTVGEGDVVYVSFERISPYDDRVAVSERIDLSAPYVDELYGTGFKELLLGREIGSTVLDDEGKGIFMFPIEEGTVSYGKVEIDFVTRCEDAPLVSTIVYPADYDPVDLRGKTAYFEIYIDNAVIYDVPAFDDTFVTETLGYKAEDLAAYSGATLTEKLSAKLEAELKADVEEGNENLVLEALKKHLNSLGELIEYPEGAVDEVVDGQVAAIEKYYENYAETYKFTSLDQAAIRYLGLDADTDWMEYVEESAKIEVKNKLTFYYIILKEGFVPTEEEIKAEEQHQLDREVDYQMAEYADRFASFTPEEYETQRQLLRAQIESWYGPVMLRDVAIYNYGIRKLAENNVTVVKQ